MSDEKVLSALRSVGSDLDKIAKSTDHMSDKLDRMISLLEKVVAVAAPIDAVPDVVTRQKAQSIVAQNQNLSLVQHVIKSSLPDISMCTVIMFYGPDLQDTKFVVECVFFHVRSAIMSSVFETRADYNECMKRFGTETDPFGRRAKESGYQSHIVIGWDSCIPETLADAFVRVHRNMDGQIVWIVTGDGQTRSGRVQIGPS